MTAPVVTAPAEPPAPRTGSAPEPERWATLTTHWPLLAVLAVYAVGAVVVPTLAPVAIGDDWVYARAAETLHRQGRLEILPPAAAVSVFEASWGALFAGVFGFSFGVLRASTVVLSALGGVAVYGLCLELGARRRWAAVGAALFLFNPLAYVLSFTFMTDPHFVALAALSAWCYVMGLGDRPRAARLTVLGSAFAGLALLSRHQGMLLPATVVAYLVVTRRVRPDAEGLRAVVRVTALPVAAAAAYVLWAKLGQGVPAAQADFLDDVVEAGPGGLLLLARRHAFIQPMYAGFYLLPLVPAVLVGLPAVVRGLGRPARLAAAGFSVAMLTAFAAFQGSPRRMPYLRSYFNEAGLGPYDFLLPPGPVLQRPAVEGLTVVCLVASVLGAAACLTWLRRPSSPERSKAGLVAAFLLAMAVGGLGPSILFRDSAVGGVNIPGLDRYLLPILPFAVVLAASAAGRLKLRVWPALVPLAAMAVFSVAGTRDSLVFQHAAWDVAREANALGVPNTRLDAGAAWSGHHLYEESARAGGPPRTPSGPWWTVIFAPLTDSGYVVGAGVPSGYSVVLSRPYSSWLQRSPTTVYLSRRPDVPGPP